VTVTIPIQAIQINPGSSVTINNLTWQEFETILDELGEQRRVRLTYYQGNLEIISPLTTLIPQLVEQAINQGTSRMLRKLRNGEWRRSNGEWRIGNWE